MIKNNFKIMKNTKEEKVILEADFEENNNKKENNKNCDCGCDCGDDCKCYQSEKKDKKKFKSFRCQDCNNISGMRLFFGLTIFLLGIFYLGRTLDWWSFSLDWNITWPVLIIFLGLSIIGGNKATKWLLWILFLSFISLLIMAVIFFCKKDVDETNYIINKNLSPNQVTTMIEGESMGEIENIDISVNRYFSGSFNREEIENKINEVLDFIYEDKGDESIEIGVDIRRK
jgi:hypothetical protein